MKRPAVSLLEMLIVIGVVVTLSTLSIPFYRTYQVHSDLNLATEQVMQGLSRARLLSQSADKDSQWGFYVPHGVLYKGVSYVNRDPAFDEVYPMPSTITLSGSSILETAYTKIEGKPSATGSIILTAVDGEQRTVVVTIAVQTEGIATNLGTTLTICHQPGTANQQTMTVVESAWPTYQKNFPADYLGTCPVASSSAASVVPSSSSVSSTISSLSSVSSASSSSSSSANGGGGNGNMTICHRPSTAAQQTMTINATAWSGHKGHGDTVGTCAGGDTMSMCPSRFTFTSDSGILTKVALDMSVKVIATQLTWGVGGPSVPITMTYTKDNGKKWTNLYSGNAISNGLTQTVSNVTAGSTVALNMHAQYRQSGWLLYDQSYATNDGTLQTMLLRRGDTLPSFISHSVSGQQDLRTILASYLDASGKLTIDPSALIVLTDYTTVASPPPDAEDFQDAILLVQFNARSGGPSCP